MEKLMVIMIAIVALVAVGGLLYVGTQTSPAILPVLIQGPTLQAPSTPAQGTLIAQTGGQIKFSIAPPSASTGGQIKFSLK